MHLQTAFKEIKRYVDCSVSEELCQKVLALPMHPYMNNEDLEKVCNCVKSFFN